MRKEVPYPEFDVLAKLLRSVRLDFERRAARSKVTWAGLQALTVIAERQELRVHCTRASLARVLQVTPGTVSPLVSGLVERGWVTEAKNSKFVDGRRKQLKLSANGQKAYHSALVMREDAIERVLGVLTQRQQRSLFRSATAMYKATEEPSGVE